jgi:hypothetical protein
MTEKIKFAEQLSSVPENLWRPLFDLLIQSQLSLESWTPAMAPAIYKQLEHPNWAPWLEASTTTIAERATVFPAGQLVIKDGETFLASLSMNQINWDGNPATLPNWDQVAGVDTTNYSETYQAAGNTLVMMSMNVALESKGQQLPTKMIEYVKLLAQELGVAYVIGSFRPSGYGLAKKQTGFQLPFWEYCTTLQTDSQKPVDPWLRSLWWNGMQLMQEDPQAMQVSISLADFNQYRLSFKPEAWVEIQPGVWECEEVGTWVVVAETATYKESNVWGIIPLTGV